MKPPEIIGLPNADFPVSEGITCSFVAGVWGRGGSDWAATWAPYIFVVFYKREDTAKSNFFKIPQK